MKRFLKYTGFIFGIVMIISLIGITIYFINNKTIDNEEGYKIFTESFNNSKKYNGDSSSYMQETGLYETKLIDSKNKEVVGDRYKTLTGMDYEQSVEKENKKNTILYDSLNKETVRN